VTRLPTGGRIDRSRPLRFTVDGVELTGLRGDTLASAMIAAGLLRTAGSMYRRRPRGILTAGPYEPNAVVQVLAPYPESLVPATAVELVDGLVVETRSGVGRLSPAPDTAYYDKTFLHVDVLVVGGGPAGIAAASAASARGARVMLVDDGSELGGRLLSDRESLDEAPALDWVAASERALRSRPEVRVLTRSTTLGYYDQNYLLVVEKRTDHLERPPAAGTSRQRLWHIRARQVVLATGAIERPMVFSDNDRPGVMLASAVRSYLNRYAVAPGRRAVVATIDDSGYATATDLLAAGVTVAAVVDSRSDPPTHQVAALAASGVPVLAGSAVCGTDGIEQLEAVQVTRIAAGSDGPTTPAGPLQRIAADLLAVAGGWTPQIELFTGSRGVTRWDEVAAAYVPGRSAQAERTAGAARGRYLLAECLADGARAGAEAAQDAGFPASRPILPRIQAPAGDPVPARPVWLVPALDGTPAQWHDHFVDLERDATVADVWRAVGAGMTSVEHVKRYTTIGTGRDQGATSGVNAVALVSLALDGASMAQLFTSTSRPPTIPVSFAAMAGRDVGHLHDPHRTTPIHPWHVARRARFEVVGQWQRAWYYPQPGESVDDAVQRECRAARTGVAVMDATTLGKIEIVGADAGEFLNRIYTNAFAKLAVGSARYGLMCTADGMVMDDGVTVRLAADRFFMTTTTGNAARVLDWLEEWQQTEWPHLDAAFTSVTEQWATIAVVGPRSREVIGRLAPDLDTSAEAFAFMTFRETRLATGVPARICRISFSGELAYEVNVASWFGLATWGAVMAAGEDLGITPYGTEAMHVLRAEKGFPIIGQDTDGTVTPYDLGMAWAVSKQKDFIGRRSLTRADTARPDRRQLVGLLPVDGGELLPEGAQLVAEGTPRDPEHVPIPMIGHVTSSYRSAALGRTFALALVASGRDRIGQTVLAPLGDRVISATITDSVLYDPQGARRDG
jgi:sarcosine oxidase subunit alpha